jgi:hypothetical protein
MSDAGFYGRRMDAEIVRGRELQAEIERLRGVMETALGSGTWAQAQAVLAAELGAVRANEVDS